VRGAAVALLVWAAYLALLAGGLWAWRPTDRLGAVLLSAAAALVAIIGLVTLRWRGGREERAIPDLSLATVLAVAGIAAMLVGLRFGGWLLWPGLGLTLFGLAGVLRELLAERRGATG
jgi:hypothetical protein